MIFWDGAGWHRGSKAQEFIKEDKKIETIYFPKYSPEENPQEHVWKDTKDKIANIQFSSLDDLTHTFRRIIMSRNYPYQI